jgi:outer membrane lipopolysaccharide assembly protein LptE/RlpB
MSLRPVRVRAGAILAVVVLLAGCGYSMSGNLPPEIKTVAVPVFRNRTFLPGIENTLTSAVARAFANSGRLRLTSMEEADSVFEAEVLSYLLQETAFTVSENVTDYRVLVTLNVVFRDRRANRVLWQAEALTDKADFRAPRQVAPTFAINEEALQRVADQLAAKIVTFAIEQF